MVGKPVAYENQGAANYHFFPNTASKANSQLAVVVLTKNGNRQLSKITYQLGNNDGLSSILHGIL